MLTFTVLHNVGFPASWQISAAICSSVKVVEVKFAKKHVKDPLALTIHQNLKNLSDNGTTVKLPKQADHRALPDMFFKTDGAVEQTILWILNYFLLFCCVSSRIEFYHRPQSILFCGCGSTSENRFYVKFCLNKISNLINKCAN